MLKTIYAPLLQFLETQQLGMLKSNLKMQEVTALLGEPDFIDVVEQPEPITRPDVSYYTYNYGDLRITFIEKKIESITIDFYPNDTSIPTSIKADWLNRLDKLEWPVFAKYLQTHNIPCKLYEFEGQFDDERNVWIQPNNLVFLFRGNPTPSLYKISYGRKPFRTDYVRVPMKLRSI